MEIFSITLTMIVLAFAIVAIAKLSNLQKSVNIKDESAAKLDFIEKSLSKLESVVKDDFRQNREELSNSLSKFQLTFLDTLREISFNQLEQLKAMTEQNQQNLSNLNKTIEERLSKLIEKNDLSSKENRDELARNLLLINDQIKNKMDDLGLKQKEQTDLTVKQLDSVTLKLDEKLGQLIEKFQSNSNQSREALDKSMNNFQIAFTNNVKDFNDLQKQKFAELEKKQGELITITELKLEKMRETVDEKLQKTLEARLGQSFELVSKQLESVQKGLGEMQSLANDVGGLKRVLSNVKTRGVMGEIQLGNILEQILAPEQYETNVKTKRSSGDHVEFAIKLPGRDDNNQPVYLPIDAKFPQEAYHLLQIAYDEANAVKAEEATRTLAISIRKFAKDIRDKYLDPPYTTDFAIMFLPIEGLYAEVVRNTDLIEQLQREYKVIVTGPTTLAAILNSLQMGFKTLAIQKRSSEVWEILGAVKTEFGKFGGILEKAQKKITEASNDIDTLVGTRTRAIERRLRQVQELPAAETGLFLEEPEADDEKEFGFDL
jgi:DNA recombination protein RmuC